MDRARTIFSQLLGFGFVCALAWAAWFVVTVLWSANPTTQAAVIGLTATVGVAAFTYWKERTRALKEAHRDKKIEVYQQFYDMMFSFIQQSKESDGEPAISMEELGKKYMAVSKGALFYGSPDVLRALSAFKLGAGETGGTTETFRLIGRVLLAMRADIGLDNKGLDEVSIHQIYINDDLNKLEGRI